MWYRVALKGGRYYLKLVTCDGYNEHPKEDWLHGEEDAVQDAGLFQPNILIIANRK